jgi:hemin uptake protein HemP
MIDGMKFVMVNARNFVQEMNGIISESGVQNIEATGIKKFCTKDLFGSAKDILISHLGEHYLLTITKQKKLLLTKVKHHLVR